MKNSITNINLYSGLMLLTLLLFSSQKLYSNITIPSATFEQDTTPPVPYCLTGVITVPLPPNGILTISAKDLDKGSFDNITLADKLKFYFDGDRSKTSITISCADFVNARAADELSITTQMWVEDEAGNRDYCTTVIIVQDNHNLCPNDSTFQYPYFIKGNISTSNNTDYAFAKITLTGPNGFNQEQNGNEFNFVNLQNGTYTLCLERNDDPLNGVTTADIVKIKRHILETELLNSPYKILAADVNLSNSLSGADITELRKLVLGFIPKFTKVPSWIFIPANYIFPPNKFPDIKQFIPSCITITIKDASVDKIDFIGIKMGNVN